MSSGESEDERVDEVVSKQIRDADKSKKLYTSAYNEFKKWRKEKGSNSFCEDVLLVYFHELSKRYAPTSLWAIFSKLKCTVNTFDKINIGKYNQLISFLKKEKAAYIPKKAETFTKENLTKFLSEAPDEIHLCEKVILIFGIAGALRRCEFVNLEIKDVKKIQDEDQLKISIDKTKNNVKRCFTIGGVFYEICSKYMKLRHKNCMTDRFFIKYAKGQCSRQPIGINKFGAIPKDIAEYLELPNIIEFTGHSLRRTSATLLVEAGTGLATLMLHGGWKSSTVTLGYIGQSMNNKKRIFETITSGIEVNNENVTKKVVHDSNGIKYQVEKQVELNKAISNAVPPSSSSISFTKNVDQVEKLNTNLKLDQIHEGSHKLNKAKIGHNSIRIISEKVCVPGADPNYTDEWSKSFINGVSSNNEEFINKTVVSNQFEYMSPQGIKSNVSVTSNFYNSSISNHSLAYKRKLSVAYHSDFGLYVPELHEKNVDEFIVFNNCNVTIIQEKSDTKDTGCQTDD